MTVRWITPTYGRPRCFPASRSVKIYPAKDEEAGKESSQEITPHIDVVSAVS
jgi:hypothetical protein